MRKISFVLIATMLLSTGSMFANKEKEGKKGAPSNSLSAQIGKLLNYNNFTAAQDGKTAQVYFTLNGEGEIVVLHVDTEDLTLDAFIKGRLNYQEVNLGTYEEGKKYTVSVRIEA